jgi:hypothetical protein
MNPCRFLVLALSAAAVAACGPTSGSSTSSGAPAAASATPSPQVVADGCKPPAAFTFTGGAGHVEITGGAKGKQSFDVSGIADEKFENSRPNDAYDPTAYYDGPWLSFELGDAKGKALVVEVEGRKPCAKENTNGSYAGVFFGAADAERFGGSSCDVFIDAFNDTGLLGHFDCKSIDQFGFEDKKPNITVHGTFFGTGKVTSAGSGSTSAGGSSSSSSSTSSVSSTGYNPATSPTP